MTLFFLVLLTLFSHLSMNLTQNDRIVKKCENHLLFLGY